MARTKLDELKTEIEHYFGIPYFFSGKGTWQEIKAVSSDYKTLKKQKIGIDCSGLAVHLLNLWFRQNLKVRRTAADMLTSPPLSKPITDFNSIQTADLIRTKNGHHVIFIIEKIGDVLYCVDSSREGRGVQLQTIPLSSLSQTNGIFRLISPQPAPDIVAD
ncbi:MAG: hypothetical protein WC596_01245 [Candidatus Shapirobacteria bacterium]